MSAQSPLTPRERYLASKHKLEKYALNIITGLTYVSADDLHVLETEIADAERDPRVIGAILISLQKKGYLIPAGYVKSRRVECHGRPIVLWKVQI